MTSSGRERLVFLILAVALVALAIDRWALTPLLDRGEEAETRKTVLLNEMATAESLLTRRHTLEPRWRQMLAGSMKRDPAEAESQVLHALGSWAADAGFNIVSLKPERSTKETLLPEIDVRAAGTGPMSAVSRFLWRLEMADIPLKVKTIQIASRREGSDDLSVQLQISTLYLSDQAKAKPKAAKRAAPKGEEL